jgi:hypothetical protein
MVTASINKWDYGISGPFSEEVHRYSWHEFPSHERVNFEWLKLNIANLIQQSTADEVSLVLLTGFPGIGKTSKLRSLYSASVKALGGKPESSLGYKNPENGAITTAGHICRSGIVATLHGDHMFRAIGTERRTTMLESASHFSRLWADDDKLARIFWDIVSGRQTSERIYSGTIQEKQEKKPLGTIEVIQPLGKTGKKVIIVEWVQAIKSLEPITEMMSRQYSLRVMKVLFDVSLRDSLIRVIRRDHDNKWLPFSQLLDHRLIESFYIFGNFIEPAFMDDETVLLDKSRDMPPFRESERSEILQYLIGYRLPQVHLSDPDKTKFVYSIIARLEDYFSAIRWVSDAEFMIWKQARDLRKRTELREPIG